MKPTGQIRLLCVDDHAFLIDGLEARLALEPDLQLVARLGSADGLLGEVRRHRPDIVLLDIEMPGPDPFEAAADVHRSYPDVRTVFLSAYVRDHYITAAVRAGAWGYFAKSEPSEVILDGLRSVAGGQFTFSPRVAERCRPPAGPAVSAQPGPKVSRLEALSPRELEVLRLIGKGLSRAEIAKAISRSPKTVDGHRESIMEKLDIRDRAGLVRFAIREGLIEP